jgi:hypothetical protein
VLLLDPPHAASEASETAKATNPARPMFVMKM